jgi:hypothetical protein
MEPIHLPYKPCQPYFTYNLRSRREVNTRDAANVRQFEHWQTDGPAMQNDRPDVLAQPILNDMNPTNSRSLDSKLYFQNATMKAGQDSFTKNSYFEGYAPEYDPRNAIRELRSAVFEDRFDRGIKESKKLLARNFTSQWLDPDYVEENNLATLKAYESLKPQMNIMEKDFHKVKPQDLSK